MELHLHVAFGGKKGVLFFFFTKDKGPSENRINLTFITIITLLTNIFHLDCCN